MVDDNTSRRSFLGKAFGSVLGTGAIIGTVGSAQAADRRYVTFEETNGGSISYRFEVTSTGTTELNPDIREESNVEAGEGTYRPDSGIGNGQVKDGDTDTYKFYGQIQNITVNSSSNGGQLKVTTSGAGCNTSTRDMQIYGHNAGSEARIFFMLKYGGSVSDPNDGSLEPNDNVGSGSGVSYSNNQNKDWFEVNGLFDYITIEPKGGRVTIIKHI